MGLGKTYSTKYLLDSNNSSGVAGQVLISTSTGVNWSDGSDIIGGPYLPLAGGTMTGTLTMDSANIDIKSSSGVVGTILSSSDSLTLNARYTGDMIFQSGGAEKMRIANGGNVGIGTTSPGYKLEINSGTTNVTSAFKSTDNQAWISIQDDDSGTYGALIGVDSDESENFVVANASASKMLSLTSAGSFKLHNYDSTNNTGTPTYLLGTDASGNVVKTNTVPGSAAGPYLPLAGGTMTGTIIQNGGNIDFSDGRSANFGNGDDLQIYHDGSNSYIKDTGTGRLILSGGSDIQLQSPAGEVMADFNGNGSVDLYYNNSKKFETTNTGVTVTGEGIFTGNVGIGTTLPSQKLQVNQTNNDIYQLTLHNTHLSTTAKARIGNWSDLVKISSNLMQSGGTKTQDNTAKASWVQTMGDDLFDISRSPAASTTLSSLMNINSSGSTTFASTVKASTYLINLASAAGIGASLGDINGAELGPGYLTVSRDDTADAKQILFYKNNVEHSYLETTTSGLNIGGAQVNINQKPNSGLAYDVLINLGTSPDGLIGYQTIDQLAVNLGASTSSNWVKSGNDIYNTNSANVGIGTTGPGSKLDIANTLGNTKLTIQAGNPSSVTGGSSIDIISRSSGSGTSPVSRIEGIFEDSNDSAIALSTTEGGTLAERMRITSSGNIGIGGDTSAWSLGKTIQINGDYGAINYNGVRAILGIVNAYYNGSGYIRQNVGYAASIDFNTSISGGFGFRTEDTTGAAGDTISLTPKVAILSNGNVGIGTTNPLRKLDLIADLSTDAVRIKNTNSNGGGLSVFAANGGGGTNRILTLGDSSENVKVAVIENGSVGIGMTSPAVPLDVEGKIRSTNDNSGSYLEMFNDGDVSGNSFIKSTSGELIIESAADITFSPSSTEKLRITSTGDIELAPSSRIVLDDQPTASTASGSGTIVKWSVSETTTAGLLYAVKTNGGWTTTDADVENRSIYMLAIALSTNANLGMLLQGFFYKSAHGFTIGLPLYISNTAGAFTTTRPTGTNDYVRIIGYATSANYIYFDPDKTWIKLA